MSVPPVPDDEHLARRLTCDGRDPTERAHLIRLVQLLASLPPPPDPDGDFPRYGELRDRFLTAIDHGDGDELEEAFLELYCHLHMHEAPYTLAERRAVDASGGYWCHAGGVSPLLKAAPWVGSHTRSIDLGSGNGLQGLLLQHLYPHALTVQVEIASRMAAIGRRLQAWLDIPEERIQWRTSDVLDQPVAGFDLVYLYRPVRPEGIGLSFYRRLGRELGAADHRVVILSIADCLGPHLGPSFDRVYFDGHLSCFVRQPVG